MKYSVTKKRASVAHRNKFTIPIIIVLKLISKNLDLEAKLKLKKKERKKTFSLIMFKTIQLQNNFKVINKIFIEPLGPIGYIWENCHHALTSKSK